MRLLHPLLPNNQMIAWLVARYLLRTVRIDAEDERLSVPRSGNLVCAFAPHSGWIDSLVIDECFLRAGRTWPTWLTKEENRDLPGVLTAGRVICIDREHPEPSAVRAIDRLLARPDGILATSLEGRRLANPEDLGDLRTLGAFKPGPVRFAIRAQAPILPVIVLGGEDAVPLLNWMWREQGALAAYRAIRQGIADPQPIRLRFLPPYREHLDVERSLRGKALGAQARLHTSKLREAFIAWIREIEPGYPVLGL
jgi:1-acyl-sn-glycerol-3-phosphate acyltransferase